MTVVALGAVLVLIVGGADVRFAFRHNANDRRAALARRVGTHVTIVHDGSESARRPMTGLLRGISRQHVRLRTVGAEIQVPMSAIREVWDGRRLLHRW